MDPKYYGIIEMTFSALVVFGIGFWQLWSLRRDDTPTRKTETSPPPKH